MHSTLRHPPQSASLGDRWPWEVPLQHRTLPGTSLQRVLDAAPLSDVTNRQAHTELAWQVHTLRGAVVPGAGFTHVCSVRYLMIDAVLLAHLAAEPGMLLSLRDGAPSLMANRIHDYTVKPGTLPGACVLALARGWPRSTLAGRLGCSEDEAGRALQGVVESHPGIRTLQERCARGEVASVAGHRVGNEVRSFWSTRGVHSPTIATDCCQRGGAVGT